MVFEFKQISVNAGVSPLPDSTELATTFYTDSDKIRFYQGAPQKIGGWDDFSFDGTITINGCVRNMYSQRVGNNIWLLFGSHTRLYALVGTALTNITPQTTATTAIANSLDSDFGTLANDPIDTVNTSTTLTVNETGIEAFVVAGDTITIAGSTAVNGVPAIEINASHIVRTVATDAITITVATAATSTGSGGGAAVDRSSGIVTVNATAHDLSNGERATIAGATAFAGLTAGNLNAEHIIRNTSTNAFDIVITDQATSSVSGGGGASTTYEEQIPEGNCDASLGRGYGVGKYGVRLYGVSKTSTSLLSEPRIWSFDAFGNNIILTPGGQTNVYRWLGDTATAPEILTNAPTAVNYVFVDNNIVVTLGASDTPNRVQWSDQGLDTVWTATAENQAGQDDIEGAGEFISHAAAKANVLLFTKKQVWTFRYIGFPLIWEFKKISESDGLIARNARIAVNGIVYWMGDNNFYIYTGSSVKEIPNTIRRFVFTDINFDQSAKCFAWNNELFSEIWWHYPSASSNECDRYVIYNYEEGTWAIGTLDRTAAEYPVELSDFHPLIDSSNVMHRHENGTDDGSVALSWSLTTNYLSSGTNQIELGGVVPDSIQTGNISLVVRTAQYPQSTGDKVTTESTLTITPTTEKVDFFVSGRQRQYTISGSVLGQFWRAGAWFELIQGGSPK